MFKAFIKFSHPVRLKILEKLWPLHQMSHPPLSTVCIVSRAPSVHLLYTNLWPYVTILPTPRGLFFFLPLAEAGAGGGAANDNERPWTSLTGRAFRGRPSLSRRGLRVIGWRTLRQRGTRRLRHSSSRHLLRMPSGSGSNASCLFPGRWLDVFHSFCMKPAERLKLRHLQHLYKDLVTD